MQSLRLTALIRENYIVMMPQRKGNRNPVINKTDFSERDLSDKSIRRIKKIGANWSLIVRYALYKKRIKLEKAPHFTFFTFTLASEQIHSDTEIKRFIFQPLFTEIQKANKCKLNYIWRAEAQFNGNIHFHVLFDKYLDIKFLRHLWNRLQDRLGYVERSVTTNPSGVDCEDVKQGTEQYLVNYITKYMSKTETTGKVNKFDDMQRRDNQKSSHKIQVINHKEMNDKVLLFNKLNPDKKLNEKKLKLVGLDKQRGVIGKLWGCSLELKELDCRLDINMNWSDAGAMMQEAKEAGGDIIQVNEFINLILFNQRPLELFIGATLFAQFWDKVGEQYLIIAPIFESYRYINFNLA